MNPFAPNDINLDERTEDSGGFLFDDAEFLLPSLPAAASNDSQYSTEPSVQSTKSVAVALEKLAASPCDRDSGVYLSDDETPGHTSSVLSDDPSQPKASSLSLKHTSSMKSSCTPHRTDSTGCRLQRPAALNLRSNTTPDASKQRSELEMRYDMIRNSKTQFKAALRSPTELLRERLNMSPKKGRHEHKVHMFIPPRPIAGDCLLPGPGASTEVFSSTSVRARAEAGRRPAWWCKFDKLVVFDGINVQDDGELQIHARTSKGLSIARRRGDLETIVIPMDCPHCQKMLNRHEWKYDVRVCKRSICWDCKERCKWEFEEDRKASEGGEEITISRAEAIRDRADSVLETEEIREEDLMRKVDIEQGRPRSPIDVVGGIQERLESK